MRRRQFLGIIAGFAGSAVAGSLAWPLLWPLAACAQQPERLRRIGVLTQGSASTHPSPPFQAFLKGLSVLGWDDGRNLKIEWRFSEGSAEPLPRLARELVAMPVDVIVTAPTEPTLAAKRATSVIPMVFVQVADPVQSGIVTSLARPEANVTGMSALATDIAGKRLALLKEMLPGIKRIAVLWNRPSKGAVLIMQEYLAAGPKLGIEIVDIGVDKGEDIEGALRTAGKSVSLVAVIDDPVMLGYADTVIRIASGLKLPLITQSALYTRGGGLMSYGPDLNELYRRGAEYVDRILRGAKPSDLPVQQPEKFSFILNLKAAKAAGIDVPALLLARADEVIE
jgi:putative tryptophan/tyrosine transport system substrate-binding protein